MKPYLNWDQRSVLRLYRVGLKTFLGARLELDLAKKRFLREIS